MNYSEENTLQKESNRIEIPEFLEGRSLKRIALPSFLTSGTSKRNMKYGAYNVLAYENNNANTDVYACVTACEVSFQQCRECSTCQGCEDNCQHGPCESACMIACEVNNQCTEVCQVVSQDIGCSTACEVSAQSCKECVYCMGGECVPCLSVQCGSCESGECGSCESWECEYCESGECTSCESGGQGCQHPNTEWTAWEQDGSISTQCKRSLVCKICGTVIRTERADHGFKGTGTYRIYNETHHQEIGACPRCGAGVAMLQLHNFVDGVCSKCGVFEGAGGGSAQAPIITSFIAKPAPNGMSINCEIVAKNATQYKFTLYDDSASKIEISSSGMTSSTSWAFSVVPNTYYTVLGEAYNKFGGRASSTATVKTAAVKPAKFIWKNTPQTSKVFRECVTSSEWERLQQTANAWRSYYGLEVYKFVQIPMDDSKFTVARTGEEFTYIYYNQIISSIKTIPKFKGSLPDKIIKNPEQWLAKDFIAFQDAVNYFLTI